MVPTIITHCLLLWKKEKVFYLGSSLGGVDGMSVCRWDGIMA